MKNISQRSVIFFGALGLVFLCCPCGFAQAGGAYVITQSVIGSGEKSSGGVYSVENTIGQPVAGGLPQNSNYIVYSGFWTPADYLPTAAEASISGRVTTAGGKGIVNAVITLTEANGTSRSVRTGTFGNFNFMNVRAGQSCVITISSKRFIFSNPTRILNVQENLTEINFTAENPSGTDS